MEQNKTEAWFPLYPVAVISCGAGMSRRTGIVIIGVSESIENAIVHGKAAVSKTKQKIKVLFSHSIPLL